MILQGQSFLGSFVLIHSYMLWGYCFEFLDLSFWTPTRRRSPPWSPRLCTLLRQPRHHFLKTLRLQPGRRDHFRVLELPLHLLWRPHEAIVIFNKNTDKSKGYGFVTFKNADGALLTLKEPSKKIDGRITVTQFAIAGLFGLNSGAGPGAGGDVSTRKKSTS